MIVGEGKPENQNHATIFAFGEGLQAIDMNQDNCLCEALKARNLLMELQPSTKVGGRGQEGHALEWWWWEGGGGGGHF